MPAPLSRHDLLDLVEGEISPSREALLRRSLARRPELQALLEEMVADRAALRTLSAPEMPRDVVEAVLRTAAPAPYALAPRAAAPALPARPATARPWRWIAPLAAAAAIVAIGTVAVRSLLLDGGRAADATIVAAEPRTPDRDVTSRPPADREVSSLPLAAVDTLDRTLHHAAPRGVGVGPSELLAGPSGEASRTVGARRVAIDGAGSVGLVIVSDERSKAIDALRRAVLSADGDVLLVRNFSLEDAVALQRRVERERWAGFDPSTRPFDLADILARTGADAAPALDANDRRRLVEWFSGAERPDRIFLGEPIAGASDLAPPAEIQLELAESGFGYAITAPAARLSDLLEALQAGLSAPAWMVPRDTGDLDCSALVPTLERWRRWTLVTAPADADGRVILPIAIRPAP